MKKVLFLCLIENTLSTGILLFSYCMYCVFFLYKLATKIFEPAQLCYDFPEEFA